MDAPTLDLPLTRGLRMSLAVAGQANATTVVPLPLEPPASRFAPATAAVDDAMVGTMQVLRIDTVERNAEFEVELIEVRTRREEAIAQLLTEARAREKEYDAITQHLAKMIAEFDKSMEVAINDTYKRLRDMLPPIDAQLDSDKEEAAVFYAEVVPAINEAQCGEHVRTMEASKESLQLDGASVLAREAKVRDRIARHVVAVHRREEAETTDRTAQHKRVEAQFAASLRTQEHSVKQREVSIKAETEVVRAAISEESKEREAGDSVNLTGIDVAMTAVRKQAIMFYGSQSDGKEGDTTAGSDSADDT